MSFKFLNSYILNIYFYYTYTCRLQWTNIEHILNIMFCQLWMKLLKFSKRCISYIPLYLFLIDNISLAEWNNALSLWPLQKYANLPVVLKSHHIFDSASQTRDFFMLRIYISTAQYDNFTKKNVMCINAVLWNGVFLEHCREIAHFRNRWQVNVFSKPPLRDLLIYWRL